MLNFNLFKKKAIKILPKINGNLGLLSSYNLEDLYFYISESKISSKIQELKDKPTMGYKIEEVVQGDDKIGNYMKGPLDCLSLFINWFPDSLTLDYLYTKAKNYDESSYMENSLWARNRIETLNGLIYNFQNGHLKKTSSGGTENIKNLNKHLSYNYYYIDYHFFLISLYRKLLISEDADLKFKINSSVLIDYPIKIDKIKKSLIDLDIWIESGLGNSILSALEKHCEETNQINLYLTFFENASKQNWRF